VILIHVPTLNERLDDIPLLASHFIKQICGEYGMQEKTISEKGIKELQKINWTGNIREFRNVIERLIILCDQEITDADVLKFAAPLK
jgi:DNA-binding NtrC family response regulator